jgi:hypothetical protein
MEVLIVIGLLTIVFSLGLFLSMDAYRGYSARSERDTVVGLLERARSRAMSNIDGKPWGVCAIGPNYVLFPGTSCVAGGSSESLPMNAGTTVAFSAPIVFSQLAATTTGGTVTITQNGRTDTVTINYEGRIDW